MKQPAYFLRQTSDPDADLRRGFSGNVNSWFEDYADAADFQNRHGALSPPRQDPITHLWCADPEVGLSGFFLNADGVSAIRRYSTFEDLRDVAIFESLDYDRGVGLDGEDVFRAARFLDWYPAFTRAV
jgi:hypothetical protein